MWSNFSIALVTLLLVLVAVFLWAVAVFASGDSIPLSSVNMHLAIRNLFFCIAAFILLCITAQLPIRRPIIVKLMVGFGLLFLGAWQELLNTLVHSDWLLVRWLEIVGLPGGILAASLGLFELGKAYRLNRLLLGSYRKIEHSLATVDQLTQLYNRRYFFATCPDLMLSTQHHDETAALITLRIANLQETNRNLGYQAGDAVLTQVARLLLRHTRSHDIAARLSGRRFAMFLPNTKPKDAEEIVQRLLMHVEHIGIRNDTGDEIVQRIDIEYVVCCAETGETFEELLQRARQNLLMLEH